MTLDTGSTFAGRYEVRRRIAEGGMGAVYEVVHRETGRRRALKVLHPHVLRDKKAREQFRREARIGGVIESEAIVDVFDAGIDEASGTPFLVMELLRGEDLARHVERRGPLPAGEVVEHLRQLSRTLDRAHGAGVVHRDLKPENLFLHERESGAAAVKILDFGVAKIVQEERRSGDTLSVGTPMFMAPEQFTGLHPVTGAVDRYAMAHVAYSLLVGEPYFDPEAEAETAMLGFMKRVVDGATESPSKRAMVRRKVRLPASFDAWFFRGTAVDPGRRHPTMQSLVESLETALGISFSEAPTIAMRMSELADLRAPHVAPGSDPPDGAGLRNDTISGTTTPHRAPRGSRQAVVLGAAALSAALVLGTFGYVATRDTTTLTGPSSPATGTDAPAQPEPASTGTAVDPPGPATAAPAAPSVAPVATASAASPPASSGTTRVAPPRPKAPRPSATTTPSSPPTSSPRPYTRD